MSINRGGGGVVSYDLFQSYAKRFVIDDIYQSKLMIVPFYIKPDNSNRNIAIYLLKNVNSIGWAKIIGMSGYDNSPIETQASFVYDGVNCNLKKQGQVLEAWTSFVVESGPAAALELPGGSCGVIICGGNLRVIEIQGSNLYNAN